MSPPSSVVENLQYVSRHLRVPEFKYESVEEADCQTLIEDFYSRYQVRPPGEDASLTSLQMAYFKDQAFPKRFMNLLFVTDRCFDVWLRKTGLDSALLGKLSDLRLSFLKYAYVSDASATHLGGLTALLDGLVTYLKGWCGNPARAKNVVPDLLESLAIELSAEVTDENLEQAQARWQQYVDEAEKKAEKITTRLTQNEKAFVANRFSGAIAQSYLNQNFKSRRMAPSVQSFLVQTWIGVLQAALEQSDDNTLPEEVSLTTRKIRAVYCDKGKAVFTHGENLIEEIEEQLERYKVGASEDLLESLAGETIAIVKGQPTQEVSFKQINRFDSAVDFSLKEGAKFKEGDWFVTADGEIRFQVLKYYAEYAQVLLCNYLGMKLEIDTCTGLNQRIANRSVKKIPAPVLFSKVLETSLNGLKKVSSTQFDAREKAAEKAREEAQRLKEEQNKAAEQARLKAEEIAARTRALAHKKEEAKRLEQEKQALESLSVLGLGAWVSIETEDGRQRFKLAVKFAAKKRYVFVDKYGVKKLEFNEASLVSEILAGRLEILSDGADFDDSLERVIGRMRMSR